MLTKKFVFVFVLFLFARFSLHAQLNIVITNIKEIKGYVEVGLYNAPEVFLSNTEQYRVVYVPVESNTMTIVFDSIPQGWYAISLMHDLNSNHEMEKNFIGIPKEPYGFSTNFHPRFSKPDFDDAEFYYNGEFLELSIELIH